MSKINLKGVTILLVDDEPMIREALAESLQLYGATVLPAGDGVAALEIALREKISLILSDVRMPGGDGMTFLRELKKQRPSDTPPFFFMTGFADCSNEEAIKAGAFLVLAKPFRLAELTSAIQAALKI